jgi:hypothetical protein
MCAPVTCHADGAINGIHCATPFEFPNKTWLHAIFTTSTSLYWALQWAKDCCWQLQSRGISSRFTTNSTILLSAKACSHYIFIWSQMRRRRTLIFTHLNYELCALMRQKWPFLLIWISRCTGANHPSAPQTRPATIYMRARIMWSIFLEAVAFSLARTGFWGLARAANKDILCFWAAPLSTCLSFISSAPPAAYRFNLWQAYHLTRNNFQRPDDTLKHTHYMQRAALSSDCKTSRVHPKNFPSATLERSHACIYQNSFQSVSQHS